MKNLKRALPATFLCLMLPSAIFAADSQPADNSASSMLSPAPSGELRSLSSQAYDGVADARTIGKDHVQLETELVNYSFNGSTPRFYSTHAFIWEPRLTVALWDNVDLFVRPSYEIISFDNHADIRQFGYITAGVKVNLWGNDDGMTGLAIKPFLSIPTTSGADLLGGADVALLVRLLEQFYLKYDFEVFATENAPRTQYVGFENSMSLNKPLCAHVEAYAYLNTVLTTDPRQQWSGSSGLGLKYNFNNHVELFAGMGFGLTRGAYDYNPRLGFVGRL